MGIHPSRPSRFEHVPLLTEMHQLPSHEHQPSTMAMTASAPYNPTPPLTTFPALTSAPLAPAPAAVDPHHANFTFYRSSVPPAGHCSPRSRRLSKLRRLMLCGASSERGGSGSRRRWSAGWRKGTRDELAYGEGTKGRRYRDDDDDDDDNVSVAESYASSLKSSASSAIVSVFDVSGAVVVGSVAKGAAGDAVARADVRECELKKRRGLGDE